MGYPMRGAGLAIPARNREPALVTRAGLIGRA
jgi:hypothetical protein